MTWLSFHTTSQMQNKTIRLATKSAGIGLKINLMKTELIKINTTAQIPVIVGDEPIRKVESFIYLGSVVDTKAGTEHDIIFRLGKVRSAPTMLKNIWASRNICTYQNVDTQLQCKYCMEQRNDVTITTVRKIKTFYNTILRRIFNIHWPKRITKVHFVKNFERERDRSQLIYK